MDCYGGALDLVEENMGEEPEGKDCSPHPTLTWIAGRDPNSLAGPNGVGVSKWVSGTGSLSYIVSFNNEPTATGPAQQVVVSETFGSNLNVLSVLPLELTIPNGTSAPAVQLSVPAGSFNPAVGLNEFVTNVDLRPSQSLMVNIDITLNTSKRALVWTLTSIDPTTGRPPVNPLIGFLPPGAGASVSFGVSPARVLATGTRIPDSASVVFDGQPPMTTATWTNTLDNSLPTSGVSTFPAKYSCLDFKVKWTGTDVGSGIQDFTVYASDNGAPFVPWLTNTPVGSATFLGENGRTYDFYSIARDRVGNLEASKTVAEATTTIAKTASCGGPPSLSSAATVQSYASGVLTLGVQITNNGGETASNIMITTVTPRVLAGAGKVSLTGPVPPISIGDLASGASTMVTLVLSVPASVSQIAVAEAGSLQDLQGKTYGFTLGEEAVP